MTMPPTRTIPPAKAIKTERTHEENQERAYIAASRRSDRSLEARVESARRASEIHKRRTGRSLRVTEQDVINEEMYEEEDDDLPMQYRRLTAHLQTNSADFNRRLAAYLTNQVAMRTAMGQMASNPFGQPYPNDMTQFGQSLPNMFQSPMMQPQQQPPHQQQHHVPQSPGGSYRQAPYPSPHHPGFRQNHGRSYSTAVVPNNTQNSPTSGSGGPHSSMDHRRMSTPAAVGTHINTNPMSPDAEYNRQTQSAHPNHAPFPPLWQDMGPFTTTLPPESQQMLAGASALDPNDPLSAAMLQGSENFMSNPYYPWGNVQHGLKGMPVHPSAYQGMSATLAPPALNTKAESLSATMKSSPSINGDNSSAPTTGISGLGLDSAIESVGGTDTSYDLPSGQGTPGDSFWSNFVDDDGWHDDATANA